MESNLSWFRSLLLLAIPFLWCALSHYGQLDLLENRLMDLRFLSRGETPVPVKVVYVDVDNEAVQAYHWPWNHSRYARLIDALFDHGKIESVGFDILFSSNAEPDFGIQEQKDGRLMFGKAIHRHQNVVLAANYVPGKGLMQETRKFPWIFEGGSDPTKNDTPELPSFPVLGPTWGIPGLIDTYMGEARFAPIFADSPVGPFYPMSLRLALLHWGLSESAITRFPDRLEICKPNGELVTSVPLQRGQLVEANWFSRWISPQNLRCSVVDVERYFTLLNSPEPNQQELAKDFFAQFKDAIVLVGAVDPLLQDLGKTPLDRVPVPQVGFHGNLVKTLISGEYLRRLPMWSEYLLVFALTNAVLWLALRQGFNNARDKLLAIVLVVLYVGTAFWLFRGYRIVLPITAPIGSTLMTGLIGIGWQLISEQKSKTQIKNMFGTYVSPQLVEYMVKTGESPHLGGFETEITSYFSDIQGFSNFSELLPPNKLVELMNEYLTVCTEGILSQGAALDKYVGDAVVAMFSGLVPLEDHAYRACVASQIVQQRLGELKVKWQSEGDKWPSMIGKIQTRIGLNSGLATVGNMGSPARFNFTMMGDNVNLAARMESGGKAYGVYTMATDATYRDCLKFGGDHVVFRELDKIIVRGKELAVTIYEVVGLKDSVTDKTHECIGIFAEGIKCYRMMDWDGAEFHFKKSAQLEIHQPSSSSMSKLNPSLVMISRCAKLRKRPPIDDWDGVYVMKTK